MPAQPIGDVGQLRLRVSTGQVSEHEPARPAPGLDREVVQATGLEPVVGHRRPAGVSLAIASGRMSVFRMLLLLYDRVCFAHGHWSLVRW